MESLAFNLVPVILIFALGFILKILGVLKQDHGDVFMRVVFYLSLPALVVLSLTRIELTKELAWLPLISFTIIMFMMLASWLLLLNQCAGSLSAISSKVLEPLLLQLRKAT